MRYILNATWMVLSLIGSQYTQAEIYKCTNKGQITFSDTPCPTQKQKCFLSDGKFGDECEAEAERKEAEKRSQSYSSDLATPSVEEKIYTRIAPRNSYSSYSGYSSGSSYSYYGSQRVSGYTRSNGTHVSSYTRSSGGGRRR